MKAPVRAPFIKEVNITAVVRRADGTVEDLGIIARQTFTPPTIKDRLKKLLGNK